MIDLETLDTTPYCVILSIGVVKFDPKGNGVIEKLLLKPTVDDQTEIHNRVIRDDTIVWWSQQKPEALENAFNEEGRTSFRDCMEKLYKFCWNHRAVWSNGAAFDVVACETALSQALSDYTNPVPWPYYTVRDTRTLFDIAGVKLKDGGHVTKHTALDDAEHQALTVQRAYKKLIKSGLITP